MYARMCSGDWRSHRSKRSRAWLSTSPTRKSTNHSDASSRICRFNFGLDGFIVMELPYDLPPREHHDTVSEPEPDTSSLRDAKPRVLGRSLRRTTLQIGAASKWRRLSAVAEPVCAQP